MKNQNSVPGTTENGNAHKGFAAQNHAPVKLTSNDIVARASIRSGSLEDTLLFTLLYVGCAFLIVTSAYSSFEHYRNLSPTNAQLRRPQAGKLDLTDSLRLELQGDSEALHRSKKLANAIFAVNQLFGIALAVIAVMLLHRAIRRRSRAETACMQTDQFLALLLSGMVKQGIYRLDPESRIVIWNNGVEGLTGYTAQKDLGQSHGILYTPLDRAAGRPERDLEAALRAGHYEAECPVQGVKVENLVAPSELPSSRETQG
jgi:PAS domain-containing protein